MCFMLYAGTDRPLPRKIWVRDDPDVYVQSLIKYDAGIRKHFSKTEVQQLGSTSGCGCDFPHVIYQNEGWPLAEDVEIDEEWETSKRHNREALVSLLRTSSEKVIELYGVWAGDFDEEPKIREVISLDTILEPTFYFKELGFYKVNL